MQPFRSFSIRAKLRALVMASVGIALLLCCVGFVFNDIRAFRAAKIHELQTRAKVLAFNSTAVLSFQDAPAAQRLLNSLSLQPTVDSACLYDAEGRILATYSRDAEQALPPSVPQSDGYEFTSDGRVELFQTVLDKNEPVGTLHIVANMSELYVQLRDCVLITGAMAVCAMVVSMAMSAGLQRTFSRPILELARASERVTAEGDYSVRVQPHSNDELGELCVAFNRMLDKIEISEKALQEANEQLEERVWLRTAELEEEIAQRKQIQADLEQSRDAAEAASRAKSEFLANMSHEIRTPMNAILGFTALLRTGMDDGDEATRQDYLETIHSSGKHLLGLINDILDLSKIEAGKLEIHPTRCSPHQVILDVISVLRVRASEQGLQLNYEWTSGVPETILTDPVRLRELLMNLVGNAIKFTRVGSVTVRARLREDGDRPQVEVQVVDTGIGIAPENLDRIFDPFMQADNSVTREFGGTGLGLAICRRIAEALGGGVSVESQSGKGSTFTVTLDAGPLEGVPILEGVPTDAVATSHDLLGPESPTLSGSRVLLVEDGDTNRRLITIVLQRAGAKVVSAENGDIGVSLALRQPFDVILMDMQMPVLDGYTASIRLRRKGITIPILALTAHAMKGDREKCESAGCSGYLSKPVDPQVLVRAVAEALGKPADAGFLDMVDSPDAPWEGPSGSPLVSTLPVADPAFRQIVADFVEYLHQKLQAMRDAVEREDFEGLAQLAHWLKGAGGTAGFPVLTEKSKRLESAAQEGHIERVEAHLAELEDLASRIVIHKPSESAAP